MRTEQGIAALCAMIDKEQAERYAREYPSVTPPKAHSHMGRRWVRVDVGQSGSYMIDEDGTIYGIKAYGVPHLGHRYGTLDTIAEWDWSEYNAALRKDRVSA